MSFVTIAVQCHNYQKRLCWMLAGFDEQTSGEDALIDVACMARNGVPCTEDVIAFYGREIKIKASVWTDYSGFQRRGFVRNRQLAECKTEWLLFADCDMVYHPEYIARLGRELRENHLSATYMLSSGRVSTSRDAANLLVNSTVSREPAEIEDAFERARALPSIRKRNVGAGFSQLINVLHAPHEGYYVDPQSNPDWSWSERHHKTRSDLKFRHRIAEKGGRRRALPEWFAENLIHLNHDRDKEAGHHLEIQR